MHLKVCSVRDLFHCRALFRWIIAKDLSKTTKDIVRPGAAASILKGVKSGKETYHQLFKKLCRYAVVQQFCLFLAIISPKSYQFEIAFDM